MKSKMLFFAVVVMAAILSSCSDDNEAKLKGDPDVVHEGEKWTIASMDNYSLMEVSTTVSLARLAQNPMLDHFISLKRSIKDLSKWSWTATTRRTFSISEKEPMEASRFLAWNSRSGSPPTKIFL
jgi:hypothetical protein